MKNIINEVLNPEHIRKIGKAKEKEAIPTVSSPVLNVHACRRNQTLMIDVKYSYGFPSIYIYISLYDAHFY